MNVAAAPGIVGDRSIEEANFSTHFFGAKQLTRRFIVTKDAKSAFPKLVRGKTDAAKDEGEKVNAKIEAAFEKMAKKMRDRADKAKGKLDGVTKADKRAVLLRRFELYADAATYLEERLLHGDERSE
ncbi:hypothetical protein ACLBX9_23790 [Methylobacterium sp. A49B]